MDIRKSVFGSGSERELFTALHSTWSQHFDLWPSLPFLNVINVEGHEVTPGEWQQLLKTSVDVTLCTKDDDRPVVSLEFDGMGHGFSRNCEYIQLHPSADPHRKLKLDLKLRIARQVDYPLLVLTYDEKVPIGSALTLTIADGVIGQIIAKKYMHELIAEWLPEDKIESIHPSIRDDYIQDQVIDAGVVADLEWNPIAKLLSHYEFVLSERFGITQIKYDILYDPELPETDGHVFNPGPRFLETFKARVEAIEKSIRVGCRVDVDTPRGAFSDTVWLHNITGHGVFPMGLAEDAAKVVVLKRIAEAYGMSEEDVIHWRPHSVSSRE